MPCSASVSQKYFSIADLSRILELPESTARYYCKRFTAHLPAEGEGRKKRYAPECVDILRAIIEEMKRSKNAFAVDLALNRKEECLTSPLSASPVMGASLPPLPETAAEDSGLAGISAQVMGIMERQTMALQEIASAMVRFVSCCAPRVSVEEQKNIENEILALKKTMRLSEEEFREDLEQMRRWLSRLNEAVARRKET